MKVYVVLADEEFVGTGFFQSVHADKTHADLRALEKNEAEEARAKKYNCRVTTAYSVEEVEVLP